MIVQSKVQKVVSFNAGVSHTAKIKESAKAFEILSGALYSDKILAVVRELSCNAYDAHIAAGKADIPFEVKLPTSWDPTFYVKDFGTGLSEDQIYNLYMTYFESTKTDSNEFIGQLGLGSKSPFSYGATFTVESRFNGEKKLYSCYKNQEMCPAVSKMDEAPTDEPNGLTISMSIKPDDINKFNTAARYALMYFAVQPNVVGVSYFAPYSLEYVLDGGTWKIRSESSVHKGVRVVQGNVSYPVDVNLVIETLGDKFNTTSVDSFKDLLMDILVPIGDVDIAPSREALTYNVRTAKNMLRVFDEAFEHFATQIQADINLCLTKWDACIMYKKLANEPSYKRLMNLYYRSNQQFMFDGHDVSHSVGFSQDEEWRPTSLQVELIEGSSLASMKLASSGTWLFNPERIESFPITADARTVVIIDNDFKGTERNHRMRPYLAKNRGNKYTRAIVIHAREDVALDDAEVQKMLDFLGNPPSLKVDELPVPPKAIYKYKAKAMDELPQWVRINKTERYNSNSFGPKCWMNAKVDLAAGGFYIDIERYTINGYLDVNIESIDAIKRAAVDLGLFPADTPIYGLNEKKKASVMKKGQWVNFFDHVKAEYAKKHVAFDTVLKAAGIQDYLQYDGRTPRTIHKNWTADYELTNNEQWLTFFKDIKDHATVQCTNLDAICNLVKNWRLVDKMKSMSEYKWQASAEWTKIIEINESLKFINIDNAAQDPKGIKLIIEAISI